MRKKKHIYFEDRTEYIDIDNQIISYPIGELMFSTLEIDWNSLLNTAKELLDKISSLPIVTDRVLSEDLLKPKDTAYCLVTEFYQKTIAQLEHRYPPFFHLFSSSTMLQPLSKYKNEFDLVKLDMSIAEVFETLNFDKCHSDFEDKLSKVSHAGSLYMAINCAMEIYEYYPEYGEQVTIHINTNDRELVIVSVRFMEILISELNSISIFRENLLKMIWFSLDNNGEYNDLKSMQRYYLMRVSGFEPYLSSKPKENEIHITHLIMNNRIPDKESVNTITPDILDHLRNCDFRGVDFYTSENICCLVFKEFEYMCENNLTIRKCEYCGEYFLPHSSTTIYCDRVIDTQNNKRCKDVAAMHKYLNKINENSAKKLYRTLANTYQMRCKRAPSCYKRAEYETWKINAKDLLKAVNCGNITIEEYEKKIQLPKIK